MGAINEESSIDEVWKKYRATGDIECRDRLIVNYLYLVKYVVGRIGSGLPHHIKLEDLYSSGVTGLIRAVEKYDIEKNSKFDNFASLLIKGAIIDEMRELDWVPRSVHQKAHQISTAQQALQQELGRDPTDEELAKHMGVTQEELDELLIRVRPAILIPLNGEILYGDEDSADISERIADSKMSTSFEVADRNEYANILTQALDDLSLQEKTVLQLYYYDEMMLKEIGSVMGLSESRISQIHTKALLKLRSSLRKVS